MTDNEALLSDKGPEAKLSLPEAHLAAAQVQARAINCFTLVLALGGLVVLAAIMFESHAWRQTVWHVADDAGVVESQAWRSLMKDFVDKFPHWPIG